MCIFLYYFITCTGVASIYLPYNMVAALVQWGHAVAQLVEALRYKSEGRGFDSQWGYRDFFIHFWPHCGRLRL
jgi:hypothetical protein